MGLSVGCPKIYDSYYLHQQLNALKAQLASITAVSGASLPSNLGVIQGFDQKQQSFAIQVMGPSTPALSSTTDSTGTSTTSTGSSLTPSAPAPPAGTLSPPTPGVGSLDRLAEAVQLQFQIFNLQMLLDGSLDDKVSPSGDAKRSLTLGFPVSIEPPTSGQFKDRRDHVAVIRVRLCQAKFADQQPPSLITLLPTERTYNVAGLTEKSFAASAGGNLGGVLSVGGGFLNAHKRYYVVQDQETSAFQSPTSGCSDETPGTAFVWEIKPVLGNRQVRSGMQTDFVQLAYDGKSPLTNHGLLDVCVELKWGTRTKSGSIDIPGDSVPNPQCWVVRRPDSTPTVKSLTVTNYAGSSLRITAKGAFLPGTRVRIGNAFVNDANFQISDNNDTLEANLAASDLLAGDISLVSRDGNVKPFYEPVSDDPSKLDEPIATGATRMSAIAITRINASDTATRIILQFALPKHKNGTPFEDQACDPGDSEAFCDNTKNPWLVTIGNDVYGVASSPIAVYADKYPRTLDHGSPKPDRNYRSIDLVVPTASLQKDTQLSIRRMLWDPRYTSRSRSVELDYPVIDKNIALSSNPGIHVLLIGSHLDTLLIKYPSDCKDCLTTYPGDPSIARLNIEAKLTKNLKQVVFCKKVAPDSDSCANGPLLFFDPGKTASASSTKSSLKAGEVSIGALSASLKGDKLENIVSISYAGQQLTYHVSTDSLVVDLVPSIYSKAGVYPLRGKADDGSIFSTTIKVSPKKP